MKKRINISLSKWVIDDILSKTDNMSQLIEEAVIKHHLAELKSKSNDNAGHGLIAHDLDFLSVSNSVKNYGVIA